ncbi:MAG: hypothetical protein WBA46_00140 [Thermomicrobiales bacterium]
MKSQEFRVAVVTTKVVKDVSIPFSDVCETATNDRIQKIVDEADAESRTFNLLGIHTVSHGNFLVTTITYDLAPFP